MSTETPAAPATTPDSGAAPTHGTTISTGLPAGVPETTPEGTTPPEGTAADQAAKPDEKPAVPEKYEFKLPEGTVMDPEGLAAFEPIAKDLGLTQEQAQKLVDLQLALNARGAEQAKAAQAQWLTDLKADKELGGPNLPTTAKNVTSALARFGSPELNQFLDSSGLGNYPALVKAFNRVGAAMAEDKVLPAGMPPAVRKSTAEIMYDKTPPK